MAATKVHVQTCQFHSDKDSNYVPRDNSGSPDRIPEVLRDQSGFGGAGSGNPRTTEMIERERKRVEETGENPTQGAGADGG